MGSENGMSDLPQARQEIAEFTMNQYVTEYHRVAAQRDELQNENTNLKAEVAGLKVVAAAQQAQIANVNDTTASQLAAMESRLASMQLERDQAVADRVVWEGLFISIQAQLRAFAVPNAPLVKDKADESKAHWSDVGAFGRDLLNVGRRHAVPEQKRSEEGISQPAHLLDPAQR